MHDPIPLVGSLAPHKGEKDVGAIDRALRVKFPDIRFNETQMSWRLDGPDGPILAACSYEICDGLEPLIISTDPLNTSLLAKMTWLLADCLAMDAYLIFKHPRLRFLSRSKRKEGTPEDFFRQLTLSQLGENAKPNSKKIDEERAVQHIVSWMQRSQLEPSDFSAICKAATPSEIGKQVVKQYAAIGDLQGILTLRVSSHMRALLFEHPEAYTLLDLL